LEVVVTQTQCQREAWRYLPVVVYEERIPVIVEVRIRVRRIDVVAADVTEHEIGHRGARVSAVKSEARARRAGLAESHSAIIHFRAEFQEVPALLPGERVGEGRDGIRTDTRPDLPLQVVHIEPAIRPADADGRRTVLFG